MGNMDNLKQDLTHLARLALSGQTEELRFLIARLARRYRKADPSLARQLEQCLQGQAGQVERSSFLHSEPRPSTLRLAREVPANADSGLSLLRVYNNFSGRPEPSLSAGLRQSLEQLIKERMQASRLAQVGLVPTRSVFFIGSPGVGKTLTAHWLAARLGVPLYVLDLSAVMSSFLGRSGENLRQVLDFAKQRHCVLLLDEIDAIAKKRSDESDVGELKRLVTVILQQLDEWPSTGLLTAATNHPEAIDFALWRRFDLVVEFKPPDEALAQSFVKGLLSGQPELKPWGDLLALALKGESFSNIEREVKRLRRVVALEMEMPSEFIHRLILHRCSSLGRTERIDLATLLARKTQLSHRRIMEATGVSRSTIRKHASAST